MNVKVRVAAICLALTALAGLVLLVVRPSLNPAHVRPLPLIALAWIAFLTAAFLLRKVPLRASVVLILLGGIAIQIAAVSAPPRRATTCTGTSGTAGYRRRASTRTRTCPPPGSWTGCGTSSSGIPAPTTACRPLL